MKSYTTSQKKYEISHIQYNYNFNRLFQWSHVMSDHQPFSAFIETLSGLPGGSGDLKTGLAIAISTLLLGTYIMILQLFGPYVERKIMARQQGRKGPYYVGWRGILQIPADLGKLLFKEDTMPENADRFGFFMSIYLIGLTSIMSFSPLPFGKDLMGGDMTVGILYIFAIFSIFPPAMFIGGWASNSKYALIGGFRSAGQLLAYEIPMFLAVLGVIGVVGSFSLETITEYQIQHGWFMFRYWGLGFVAALIFYIAGLAETERIPFDIPEAEAELVMGPRTEFSGWRYAIIMMAEYVHLTVNSLLFIYVFLGGYDFWPFPADMSPEFINNLRHNQIVQFVVMFFKFFLFVFLATTVRTAFPRMRIDQLLSFGWKQLLPISLAAMLGILWLEGVFV